jgi:hypothetical protein
MWENDSCGEVIYFKLLGEKCMKIITMGQIFLQITNYQGFRNNPAHLYEFVLFGTQVQTKIQITFEKFQIIEFWINQVLLYIYLPLC